MLGAARVRIPENNLDDLHSSREEDGTLKIMDPQDLLGCDPLALLDGFTPLEDNIAESKEVFGGFCDIPCSTISLRITASS
ncbi:hypothetical protein Tco_1153532 [Tanacetum coccineum]